ncbi:hypothetical protein SFRURICE_019177, partial [Spodoptera frugiperda]
KIDVRRRLFCVWSCELGYRRSSSTLPLSPNPQSLNLLTKKAGYTILTPPVFLTSFISPSPQPIPLAAVKPGRRGDKHMLTQTMKIDVRRRLFCVWSCELGYRRSSSTLPLSPNPQSLNLLTKKAGYTILTPPVFLVFMDMGSADC